MSLAKISPAFDQFLENFILYELTKDSIETTNYETKVIIVRFLFLGVFLGEKLRNIKRLSST